MARHNDLKGQQFGWLKVLAYGGTVKKAGRTLATWECQCVCGNKKVVDAKNLIRGTTKSCGCYHRLRVRSHIIKHGFGSYRPGVIEDRFYSGEEDEDENEQ